MELHDQTKTLTDDVAIIIAVVLSFYDRRVRRIIPPLAVVLVASSIAAYAYLLPSDMLVYGGSVVRTVTFLSNHFFIRNSEYFAEPAATMPLLHTWSLARLSPGHRSGAITAAGWTTRG